MLQSYQYHGTYIDNIKSKYKENEQKNFRI